MARANNKRQAKKQRRIQNSNVGINADTRSRNLQEGMECMSNGRRGTGDRARQVSAQNKTDQYYAELYARHWEAKKIIDIPVDDMLRKPWEFEGLDEGQEKVINNEQVTLKVYEKFKSAMTLERLIGGSVIVMGIAQPEGAELTEELNVDTIGQGDLKFLNVINKGKLSVAEWYEDPMSANFDEPKIYSVNGQLIHESRLLIFDGQPLIKRGNTELNDCTVNSSYRQGFGDSVLKPIANDIFRAEGTRNAAYHLVNMASVIFTSADTAMLDATKSGGGKLDAMQQILDQISIYRGAVIDKIPGMDAGGIQQHSASFGSVPELINTNLEVLCGAADIPAVRFLNQAPSGLNTDGKSALENYYGRLESEQQAKILPQLNKLMPVLFRSVFGSSSGFDNVFIEFPPLWVKSDSEIAETRSKNATALNSLSTTMAYSDEDIVNIGAEFGLYDINDVEGSDDLEDEDNADNPTE